MGGGGGEFRYCTSLSDYSWYPNTDYLHCNYAQSDSGLKVINNSSPNSMTTPTLSSPEFLGNLALPSLPGVYAANVEQPIRRGHQNPMDTINASEKNRRRVQYWQSRDVMSMCVCDCPGLPSNSPCYCTDTLQTWRKELDKIPSAHTITGAYHSPGLGSFNCANALLCVNASVTWERKQYVKRYCAWMHAHVWPVHTHTHAHL